MRDTKSIFQSLGRKKKYIKHSKSKIDRPNIWGKINCFLEVITFPSVLFEIFSGVQYFLFWDKILMWEDQIFKTEERHCSSAEFQSLLPDTDCHWQYRIQFEVHVHCTLFPEAVCTTGNRKQYPRSVSSTYTAMLCVLYAYKMDNQSLSRKVIKNKRRQWQKNKTNKQKMSSMYIPY